MTWQPETRLGPYVLLEPIGAGGMGEVWTARDTRLNRTVAIKRLTAQHSRRFDQEARAIAALNHPNICTLHDIGPDYLVMEFVEGEPLRGPLALLDALAIALQIARALQAAHAKGVIHCDLKPANVLVNDGRVKLLDFGVARLSESEAPDVTRTGEGTVTGTIAYMSPEQAQGKSPDPRSDIFSFGAVLYELLSGRRAFEGASAAEVLSAVLRDDPRALNVPEALNRVVRKCLEKSPSLRFQNMADVISALASDSVASEAPRASIAVLPFANLSGDADNEYFADGLAEEIINALAQVQGLKVIARTSAFAFKGRNEDVRRIADALGVNHILEGSVRRAGSRIRVTAQLIAARDGTHVWSERYDRPMSDVFAMQDEIAEAITIALKGRLGAAPSPVRRHTPNLPAYEAFLKGRHNLYKFTPDAYARARTYFNQAIRLDPAYSDPHAELGLGYFIIGMHGIQPLRDVAPLVREEVQCALELNPSDARPRFLLGAVALGLDYDWGTAAEHFGAAMTSAEVTADARWLYASLYLGALGRFHESSAEMGRAVEQDPLNPTWRAVLSAHLTNAGLFESAIDEAEKGVELDPNYFVPHFILGEAYLASGRLEEAITAFETSHRLGPWNAIPTGLLATALDRAGERARAQDLIREMGDSPNPVWGRVLYHLHMSELDTAAEWYARMIQDRDPFALVYANAPVTKQLHEHPRWPHLAGLMNLPFRS